MAPTLSPYAHETGVKDSIIIQRNVMWNGGVKRGDVVTFWKPHRPEEISVKRVIAVAGDVVYPWRGYALDPNIVNKERVPGGWDGLGTRDEDAIGGEEVEVGKVTVPKGHVWVEGDNWRQSYDSLDFGPISLGLVDGKAIRVWREWWKLRKVDDGRMAERKERSKVIEGSGSLPMGANFGD
jgi:inner membrane protease subunit 2